MIQKPKNEEVDFVAVNSTIKWGRVVMPLLLAGAFMIVGVLV